MTNSPLALFAALMLALAVGCSDDNGSTDKDTAQADGGQDAGDTGATDTGGEADSGAPKALQWKPATPTVSKKMRAIAVDPAKPGSYVVVADGAKVLRFADGAFTDASPGNISGANLRGVHVDASGAIVVAGDKSALAIHKNKTWQVAGEIPPSPAVEFLDVDGDGGVYWAVGVARAAWRYDEGVWAPQTVTITGADEGIGKDAQLVAVAVTGKKVWIACVPGAKSPGLALRKTKDGWKSYPLAQAPRDIWGDEAGADGGVCVVGGAASEYVARFSGDKFTAETGLQWSQGFNAVDGLSADAVWAAAFKGQLRRRDKAGWEVVTIEAPPGTPDPFPTPTSDLVGVAVHGAKEYAVITNFKLYRYGEQ